MMVIEMPIDSNRFMLDCICIAGEAGQRCVAGRPPGRLVYDTSMINLSGELVHIRLANDPEYAYFLMSQAFFADLLFIISK
jgi:hypothetical protein